MNEPAIAESAAHLPPVDVKQTHETASHKHALPLAACRLDPSGRYAFAGAEDLNAYRWDLKAGKKSTLKGNRSWVRCIDFDPAGEVAVTADWAGTLCWWRVADDDPNPKPLATLEAHQGSARWVRHSPDGRFFATCGNDLLVKLWSAADRKLVWAVPGHQRHPYAVAFHPVRDELYSEDLLGHVNAWSLADGKLLRTAQLSVMTGYDKVFAADMGGARDMAVSLDGKTLACAGITNVKNSFAGIQDPIVVLIDADTLEPLRELKVPTNFQGVAWGVKFHPEGFVLGCGANRTGAGALWFWTADKPQPFHSVATKSAIRGCDLSTDGRTLIAAHADGTLRGYALTAKATA